MKKILYFVVCFIFMFGLCGEVNASTCGMSQEKYNELCSDDNPIPMYLNSPDSSSSSSSGKIEGSCGGEITSKSSTTYPTISKEKSSSRVFNPSCNCDAKKFKIVVLIDRSHSMDINKKFEFVKEEVKKIVKAYSDISGVSSILQICYFGGNCSGNIPITNSNVLNNGTALSNAIEAISGDGVGRNTNYIQAYETAKDSLQNTKRIPIIYFLTDGYPTELGSNDKLGWLSTARYAYESLKELKNLKAWLKRQSNIYSWENAKIYTRGIGIKSSDYFAKYILDPSSTNYNRLGTNGSVSEGEGAKLKSYLSGTTSGYEVIMGVPSYPDKGLVTGVPELGECQKSKCVEYNKVCKCTKNNGTKNWPCDGKNSNGVKKITKCKAGTIRYENGTCKKSECTVYRHRIIFSPNFRTLDNDYKFGSRGDVPSNYIKTFPFYRNTYVVRNNLKKGIMFLVKGITNANYSDISLKYVPAGTDDVKTVASSNYDWIALNTPGYDNTYVLILHADFFYAHPKAEYRLVWDGPSDSVYARQKADTGITGLNASSLYDVVDGSSIDDDSIINFDPSIIETPSPEQYEQITVTNVKHSSAVSKSVNVNGYYIKGSSGNLQSVNLIVPIVISETVQFNPGDPLKRNLIYVQAGRGFSLTRVGSSTYVKPSVISNIKWYYQQLASYSGGIASNPILGLGTGKKVTLNDLYDEFGNKVTYSSFDSSVWNEIRKSSFYDKSNDISEMFEIFDSNNKNLTSSIAIEVKKTDTSGTICNANRSDCTNEYQIIYEISQLSAYVHKITGNVIYGNVVNEGEYSTLTGDNKVYYVPKDYPTGSYDINIDKVLSSVKGVSSQFINKCSINITSNIITNSDSYSYRSIDVNAPFPKAGMKYSLIPKNWRNWYCESSSGDTCNLNKSHSNRLSGSYNNIFYTLSLDNDTIFKINNDTKTNGGYSVLGSVNTKGINADGSSELVRQYYSPVPNSYCKLGEFDDECDKW